MGLSRRSCWLIPKSAWIEKLAQSDVGGNSDIATNPNNATLAAANKQDLLGWNPNAQTKLCGGSGDPIVVYNTHTVAAYNDFKSRGLTNVSKVDVDPAIQQIFGTVLPNSPPGTYHAFVFPFCHQVAKALFDQLK